MYRKLSRNFLQVLSFLFMTFHSKNQNNEKLGSARKGYMGHIYKMLLLILELLDPSMHGIVSTPRMQVRHTVSR